MAEPIEMPFALWTRMGPREHVLHESARWRHLANMTEPSFSGGDAAFLSNYFNPLLLDVSINYYFARGGGGEVL